MVVIFLCSENQIFILDQLTSVFFEQSAFNFQWNSSNPLRWKDSGYQFPVPHFPWLVSCTKMNGCVGETFSKRGGDLYVCGTKLNKPQVLYYEDVDTCLFWSFSQKPGLYIWMYDVAHHVLFLYFKLFYGTKFAVWSQDCVCFDK